MTGAIFAAALLWPAAAWAQDQQTSWQLLHDSLLVEALDADLPTAAARYSDLARHLGPDDPMHSEALYQLGRVRYLGGEVELARAALRECVRTGVGRGRCLALLGRIELEQGAIHDVPVRWTFDDADHGVVHPWPYTETGVVRLHASPADGGVLEWLTTVDPTHDDQLVVGFREPTPSPRGVRFSVRSADLTAQLRVQFFDVFGRRFTADGGVVRLPPDRWTPVVLDLAALRPDDDGARLDPAQLDRMVLQDVTAYFGEGSGRNTLWFDELEVW